MGCASRFWNSPCQSPQKPLRLMQHPTHDQHTFILFCTDNYNVHTEKILPKQKFLLNITHHFDDKMCQDSSCRTIYQYHIGRNCKAFSFSMWKRLSHATHIFRCRYSCHTNHMSYASCILSPSALHTLFHINSWRGLPIWYCSIYRQLQYTDNSTERMNRGRQFDIRVPTRRDEMVVTKITVLTHDWTTWWHRRLEHNWVRNIWCMYTHSDSILKMATMGKGLTTSCGKTNL